MTIQRPFRHLCPEADMRDAMTDTEFWEHVANNLSGGQSYDPFDADADGPDLDVAVALDPCAECGEVGACAYDSEGRPLIHAVRDEPDDT